MERVRRAVANIRQQLGRLGPTHRLLIGCVAVLIVMGLFLTLPYGKFVHGIYRFGALLRNAREKRR